MLRACCHAITPPFDSPLAIPCKTDLQTNEQNISLDCIPCASSISCSKDTGCTLFQACSYFSPLLRFPSFPRCSLVHMYPRRTDPADLPTLEGDILCASLHFSSRCSTKSVSPTYRLFRYIFFSPTSFKRKEGLRPLLVV